METIATVSEMTAWSRGQLRLGETIGFVPTMGYLHEGHLSLMHLARTENSKVVASIFVNPTQFGTNEDLSTYPRDPESDTAKCSHEGVDVLFMPDVNQIDGEGYQTFVEVEGVSGPLCGLSRPGHFKGVATVVLKLLNMVKPSAAYFGMKDYQQLRVIMTMVRDLNVDTRIVACPTIREADGLAMSSRNAYLSRDQRKQAVCLSEALAKAKELFDRSEPDAAKYLGAMTARIEQEPDAEPEYIKLVDPDTLEDLTSVRNRCLAVMAVRVGNTRLIDNMLFEA